MEAPNVAFQPGTTCHVPISFMCTFTPVLNEVQLPAMTPQVHSQPLHTNDHHHPEPPAADYTRIRVPTPSNSPRGHGQKPLPQHTRSNSTPNANAPRHCPKNASMSIDPRQLSPLETLTTAFMEDAHADSSYDDDHEGYPQPQLKSKGPATQIRQSMRNTNFHKSLPRRPDVDDHDSVDEHSPPSTPSAAEDTPLIFLEDPHGNIMQPRSNEPSTTTTTPPNLSGSVAPIVPLPSNDSQSHHRSIPVVNQSSSEPFRHRSIPVVTQSSDLAPSSSNNVLLSSILRNSLTLTHLEIEPSITTETFRSILSQTPALRSLDIKLISTSSTGSEGTTNTMLKSSSLESLSIKTMIHPGNLLSNLTLPNLVNLSLNALHGTFSRETKIGLFKLLKTSKCSLITLSLIDVYPRESELVNCLRHNACATLQNLIIRSTISPLTKPTFRRRCITDGTINTLAATSSKHAGPAFCPKLKYLELSHCDTTEEVFVNMVKTRVGPGSFHLDYAFRSQGPDSEAVARKLAVFSTTHPLTFRSMLMQVITTDM